MFQHQIDRNEFDAARRHRQEEHPLTIGERGLPHAEEFGQAGPGDVGGQQADLPAAASQAGGQQCLRRGFADAALATHHGQNMANRAGNLSSVSMGISFHGWY